MTELLDQLQAEGELAGRGGFSIDADKAREKLRQYQLAQPHRYVLLLVEAAVLAGASQLRFRIDSDDVELRLSDASFSADALENLYSALFTAPRPEATTTERTRWRASQQLALAVNAAMALNPRWLRIESVGRNGRGACLDLRGDRKDVLEPLVDRPQGTLIHVKERFRPGLLVEFLATLRGREPVEAALLREHCRWSPTPVWLNDELLSGPLSFSAARWIQELQNPSGDVHAGPLRGAALGLRDDGGNLAPAAVEILVHGVLVERVALDHAVPGFSAVYDGSKLERDVSQARLRRDQAFTAALEDSLAAHDRLVAELADAMLRGAGPDGATDCVHRWLRGFAARGHQGLAALRRALETKPSFAHIAAVPLWPLVGGGLVDTRTLLTGDDQLRIATQDLGFESSEMPLVLLTSDRVAHALIHELFPDDVRDVSARLHREWESMRQREAFLRRPHPPKLGEAALLVRETIFASKGGATIRGELGLLAPPQRGSWIRLVHRGCLLSEHALDLGVAGLVVVIEAPLDPKRNYDGARANAKLAELAELVLDGLERLLIALAGSEQIAETPQLAEIIHSYLCRSVEDDLPRLLLRQLGFGQRKLGGQLHRLRARGGQQRWRLDGNPRLLTAFEALPLFVGVGAAAKVSLAQLRERIDADGHIGWLSEFPDDPPQLDALVLVLTGEERELLRRLFGDAALHHFTGRLAWLRRRERFLTRPLRPVQLPSETLVKVAIHPPPQSTELASLSGELGLLPFVATELTGKPSLIELRVRGRAVEPVELELPLPGLRGWVACEDLELDEQFERLAAPGRLRRSLFAALVALVRRHSERATAEADALTTCEWWALAAVGPAIFGPGPELFRGYLALRRELGDETAVAEVDALLALLLRYRRRDFDRALSRLRRKGELPTAKTVRERLNRPAKRLAADYRQRLELRRQLLALWPKLAALALFRTLRPHDELASEARVVSWLEVAERLADDRPLEWASTELQRRPSTDMPSDPLRLDAVEHELLRRMVGDSACEDVSAWLAGRARFERRRRITDLRLPPGATLVAIDVDAPGVRGELGYRRQSSSDEPASELRVLSEGREVTRLALEDEPLALLAVLDIAELELTDEHDDLTRAGRRRVEQILSEQRPRLEAALVAAYPQLDAHARQLAARLVRRQLRGWPPGRGHYAQRAKHAGERFAALAALPVFPGLRRAWSAAELAAARQRAPLDVSTSAVVEALPEDNANTPVLVLAEPDIHDTVRALFGPTRDIEAAAARRRAIAERRARAEPLPQPPADYPRFDITAEGLSGALWPSDEPTQLHFGADGRTVVAKSFVEPLFWCRGAITGPRLKINRVWTDVHLTRQQTRMLRRSAEQLYLDLVDELATSIDQPPEDDAGRRRLAASRSALRGLFLRRHRRSGERPRPGSARGRPAERIYARCWALPLLRLADGRWISPDVARREQPIELAGLGLWRDPVRVARGSSRRRSSAASPDESIAERPRNPSPTASPSPPTPQPPEALPPRPEAQLLAAVRRELSLVRAAREGLLANHLLDTLVLSEGRRRGSLFSSSDGRIRINTRHKLFQTVLAGYRADPGLVTLLASMTYSFLNMVHPEVADEDAAEFLLLHTRHVETRFAAGEGEGEGD